MLPTFEIDFFSLSYLYERESVLAKVLYIYTFLTFSFLFCRLLEFVNTFSSWNVVFLSKLVVVFNSL